MLLHTARHGSGGTSADDRFLRIVLKVSSAKRGTLDILCRCQPQMHTEHFHFLSDHIATDLRDIIIPSLCQSRADRDCDTVLVVFRCCKFRFRWLWCHRRHHLEFFLAHKFHKVGKSIGIALDFAIHDLVGSSKTQSCRTIRHVKSANAKIFQTAGRFACGTCHMGSCCTDD